MHFIWLYSCKVCFGDDQIQLLATCINVAIFTCVNSYYYILPYLMIPVNVDTQAVRCVCFKYDVKLVTTL